MSRAAQSAGVLVYRRTGVGPEVLLVHPGGPYWKNKDANAWSIPKGLLEPGEDPREAALREFAEETGVQLEGELQALGSVRQPSGKTIHAFAAEADIDADAVVSNTFELEWPPNTGQTMQFPEVDAAAWYPLDFASRKILKGRRPLSRDSPRCSLLSRLRRLRQRQDRLDREADAFLGAHFHPAAQRIHRGLGPERRVAGEVGAQDRALLRRPGVVELLGLLLHNFGDATAGSSWPANKERAISPAQKAPHGPPLPPTPPPKAAVA